MQSNRLYNEQDYLLLLKAGEERGLAWFFEHYYPALVKFAQGYVKEQSLGKDIASEAFLKLWQHRSRFEYAYAVRAFLYIIVRNASISQLRKLKTVQAIQQELSLTAPLTEGNILQSLVEKESRQELITAISKLPPGCREVVKMIYLECKCYKEIASELGLSISTIRNQRARGISLLKKAMLPFS